MDKEQSNVRVVCRVRPLNATELQRENATCLKFPSKEQIQVIQPNKETQNFSLDRIFNMSCSQAEIFNYAAKPVIDSVLEGFNGTIFAYGQTSSGKTHTMQGPDIHNPTEKGIIPRMVDTVFDHICSTPEHIEFRLRVSIVEIYMEKIRDLLDVSKVDLKIREKKDKGIYIEDVTEKFVSSEQEVYQIMTQGNMNRAVSATNMNAGSSRSHLVFILTINMTNINDYSAKTGKLSLIDLAGSEKISKTGATGQTLEEGKKINLSLTTLGNVINALTDGKSQFIPYRNSKLTRVLQESLGGNSKTTLIVTASPSPFNSEETISTLRFGCRAKAVQNKAKVNRELTVGELQVMLTKAENTINLQNNRVNQLEAYIKTNGLSIPEYINDNLNITKNDNSDNEADITIQENNNKNILTDVPCDKCLQLQQDLEREKESVKLQTEKLNNVKYEFDMMNTRTLQLTTENQQLNQKLSELETNLLTANLEQQENQESIIEDLEAQIVKFKNEIEELKNNQKNLHKKEQQDSVQTQTVDLIQLGQKFLEELDIFMIQDTDLTLPEKQVLELGIKQEFEGAFIDHDLFLRIYETVRGFKQNTIDQEREDNVKDSEQQENQLQMATIDLKRKDDKIKLMENEIKKLKETNQHLNKTMSNGEKNLNSKMKNLEYNVEQLTVMYNQLMKNRSELKAHAYNQEKKIKRKEELIKKFQVALQDEKHQSYKYRSKYETLKTMVCQNDFGFQTSLLNSSQNNTNNSNNNVNNLIQESNNHIQNIQNQLITQQETNDTSQMLDNSQFLNNNNKNYQSRIVKDIRGGQNRNQNQKAQQNFIKQKLQNEQ